MRITMAKWQNNKATGPDGIALEALKLIFDDDNRRPKIAELLNDSLYRGVLPLAQPQELLSCCPRGFHFSFCIGGFPSYKIAANTNGQAKVSKELSCFSPFANWRELLTNGEPLSTL